MKSINEHTPQQHSKQDCKFKTSLGNSKTTSQKKLIKIKTSPKNKGHTEVSQPRQEWKLSPEANYYSCFPKCSLGIPRDISKYEAAINILYTSTKRLL